jgi:hypothetical protein
MTVKELQNAAKADAMRKRKMRALSRKGWATHGKVNVIYYPDSNRFAYFLESRRVNRSDIEGLL